MTADWPYRISQPDWRYTISQDISRAMAGAA